MSSKSILTMSNKEAKKFLLKSSSYVSFDLPTYINFDSILSDTRLYFQNEKSDISSFNTKKHALKDTETVHYTVLSNKDSNYGLRPLTIMHPLVYVDIVTYITKRDNWEKLLLRFEEFQQNSKILCISLPFESKSNKTDLAENISNWWKKLEQEQIYQSLNYKYCMITDITDCYSSIYTHTIPWALHGKNVAKDNPIDNKLMGNMIDKKISNSQNGQTNGILQGNILMDFIAEMVLGYADMLLTKQLEEEDIQEYKIIRYRDDYRIFSNSKSIVREILKYLTQILNSLNLKVNSSKTFLAEDMINDAIKPDKLYWDMHYIKFYDQSGEGKRFKISIQKHLLQIRLLAIKYPNSGSINKALTQIYKERIYQLESMPKDNYQLIAILVDIMQKNQKSIKHIVAILSKLFNYLEYEEVKSITSKIIKKFDKYPSIELVEIWLQRLTIKYDYNHKYKSKLCAKLLDKEIKIWNSDWTNKNIVESSIVDQEELDKITSTIPIKEVDLFYLDDY
ncbi:RNA-directed DNA polymerase [Staphylococcus warneri]|uniref:RNA-directed DNA polymerase n=2 Tax=Staphylococcus warneri TaxID=1292 RepID=UPI0018ECA542|nr:RNA-directed DNA polymerase [Staphylococcus warneri]